MITSAYGSERGKSQVQKFSISWSFLIENNITWRKHNRTVHRFFTVGWFQPFQVYGQGMWFNKALDYIVEIQCINFVDSEVYTEKGIAAPTQYKSIDSSSLGLVTFLNWVRELNMRIEKSDENLLLALLFQKGVKMKKRTKEEEVEKSEYGGVHGYRGCLCSKLCGVVTFNVSSESTY